MNIEELAFWNSRAYGSAVVLKRSWLRVAFVIFCAVTPATNWLIPFCRRVVKRDIKITYERGGLNEF